MKTTWRTPLKKYIEEHYIQNPAFEWFNIRLSSSGLLNLTIISNRFTDMSLQERREQIWAMLRQLNGPTSTGFLSLYTTDEANSIRLYRPASLPEQPVYTWLNLADWAADLEEPVTQPQRAPRVPRTIAFYSYKGGVGRTTALVHVAAILARRGRKVVVVDLDLEAPGLSAALNLNPAPSQGIVDYFYERAFLPDGVEPSIAITDIFSEVRLADAPGRLFVVPTGTLDLDYLAKVDDLPANARMEHGEDLWSVFYREITEQLQPDVILVDSRTGFNAWGAFSLLRAADKAIIFLYPNDQNQQGINLLMQALSNRLPVYFVFSPVPMMGGIGHELVKRQWETLQTGTHEQENGDSDAADEPAAQVADPIEIPYMTEIALAESYPIHALESFYAPIANIIDEETTTSYLSDTLNSVDERRKIVRSLQFPEIPANARDNTDLATIFQRTADFDKFLDSYTCLIHGRKGTGKSALYWLLLRDNEKAQELARGRLTNINCFSAHGRFGVGPSGDDFNKQIEQTIKEYNSSWEAFWRSYLLLRLHQYNQIPARFKGEKDNKYQPVRSLLNNSSREGNQWSTEHLNILLAMLQIPALDTLAKDMLSELDTLLRQRQQEIWLLYDDLDEDLRGKQREDALVGLFRLVQSTDARKVTAIRYKIFLREDIWNRLIFDNKSHFNGRDILLQWTSVEFFRLALHQALKSTAFKDLVDRFALVADVDQADSETLEKALQLLWGNRLTRNPKSAYVSKWVYNRLTDTSKTTFPRSLNVLLREAQKAELTTPPRNPFSSNEASCSGERR